MLRNKRCDRVFRQAACFGYAADLDRCRCWADLGVEAAAGGCDQVDGNCPFKLRISVARRLDAALGCVLEALG